MAEVVRTAIGPDERLWTRRSRDDRLFVRWPRAYAAFARAVLRLPPRSRLRRALLRRQALSGWSAYARGDLDVQLVRYARDCLFDPWPETVGSGLRRTYRGQTGYREFAADFAEAYERMDPTPLEVLDAGDRFVVLGHFHIRGHGSGVELDSPLGQALWHERGLVVRECMFTDWNEALRAAGLPANAPGDLGLASEADSRR